MYSFFTYYYKPFQSFNLWSLFQLLDLYRQLGFLGFGERFKKVTFLVCLDLLRQLGFMGFWERFKKKCLFLCVLIYSDYWSLWGFWERFKKVILFCVFCGKVFELFFCLGFWILGCNLFVGFKKMTVEEIRGNMGGGERGNNYDNFPIGLRVLAVDDDPICLKLLDGLLRKCQYQGNAWSMDFNF